MDKNINKSQSHTLIIVLIKIKKKDLKPRSLFSPGNKIFV